MRPTIPTARHTPATVQLDLQRPAGILRAHPLGPIVSQPAAERPGSARAIAGLVLVGCVLLLAVAARLEPAAGGIGTHEQLGHPPCSVPMLWGVPCPTCGMTTAFAHAARGQMASAFHAQPAGLSLALAAAVAAVAAGRTLVTGRAYRINWTRVSPLGVGFGVVGVLLGGWVYKIVITLCR